MEISRLQPIYCPKPAFAHSDDKRETAAQANGRRYEEKALQFLEHWCKGNGYEARSKTWVQYFDEGGRVRYCEIDFMAIGQDSDNLLLVEVKLRHTREAFKQLDRYKRLLRALHPPHHISCIELCRYFDRLEYPCELLPELRPHILPAAAVIFEPREWTPAIN